MYLVKLYLVTIETFVVQRSRSSPPSMGYTTLENTLDQEEMEAMCTMCTCSGSKILINGKIGCLYTRLSSQDLGAAKFYLTKNSCVKD